jgi:alpha-ketoglutarate-dependent taurine dioxygenase
MPGDRAFAEDGLRGAERMVSGAERTLPDAERMLRDAERTISGLALAPLFPFSDRLVLATPSGPPAPLAPVLRSQRAALDALIDRTGGILFRGFTVDDHTFADAVAALCDPLPYIYRSTPRTELGGGIYTATEYPASQSIPMHCENAYQRDWPMRLWFHCACPATRDGETPLADVARVTDALDPALVRRFAARGVMYVRNYRPGLDLPWQTVFQTTERADVERYCAAHDIALEWLDGDALRTRQICPAVVPHPRTGRPLWFNQAHLFHVSSLAPAVRDALLAVYRPDDLPRHATFGDGSALEPADLDAIRAAFDAHTMQFPWQRGDTLVIDNMAIAHGRRPFTGPRRILVAMGAAYSEAARRTI